MQKATVFGAVIIGVSLAVILFFIFQPFGLLAPLNTSCASFGISKLGERELAQISNNPEYRNIMTLSYNDISEIPKLPELINKVSKKIQFNDDSRFIVTSLEMEQYYQNLAEKFKLQKGFRMEEKKDFVLIEYDKKIYFVAGFSFPKSGYDRADEIELVVVKDTGVKAPKIILGDDDFVQFPKIKKAIDEIGTYTIYSFESVGVQEHELGQYGKWFEEKYQSKYGNTTGTYSYFKYDDKIYSVQFSIC